MTEETTKTTEMSVFNKIVGIFTSPREAFESINQNPSWLIPFLIGLVFFLIFQYTTVDIQIADSIATIDAMDLPAEHLESARERQTQGFSKYSGYIFGPIIILISWVVIAAYFLLMGKWTLKGESNFKKLFAMVAWSSLIGILSFVIMSFLITSKGTLHGVGLDLSILLTTPPIGVDRSFLFLFLSKIDFFVIWQLILWTIGLSVTFNTSTNKTVTPVLILWAIWIAISIPFTMLLESLY